MSLLEILFFQILPKGVITCLLLGSGLSICSLQPAADCRCWEITFLPCSRRRLRLSAQLVNSETTFRKQGRERILEFPLNRTPCKTPPCSLSGCHIFEVLHTDFSDNGRRLPNSAAFPSQKPLLESAPGELFSFRPLPDRLRGRRSRRTAT